jgi:hypothetical protein
MKDWINLVERAANGDANIRHAAEILHAHMVHGRAQDWQYEKLLTLLPRPAQGATLYRAEPMLVEDIERLDQGIRSPIKSHFFSWTKDASSLKTIAIEVKMNAHTLRDTGKPFKIVVIKKNFPAEQIVVDLNQFRHNYPDSLTPDMMRDLAIHFNEEEVLVLERDRVMNRQNTVVLKDSMTNRIKAMLGMSNSAVNV